MRKIFIVIVMLFVCMGLSKIAFSQQTEAERRIEDAKRKDLEITEQRILREEMQFYIDHGGWLSANFSFNSNDDNNQDETDLAYRTHDIDLRYWFRGTLLGVLEDRPENDFYFYLRVKNKWIYKDPSDAENGVENFDYEGMLLDMGYINLDFAPLFNLRAGRQYMRLGRGIAYNNVHDGIEFSSSYSKFDAKVFVSTTKRGEDNIDYSVPGYDREADRNFVGVETNILTIPGHRPYAYVLVEEDYSKEEPDDVTYEYDYDGTYIGLGSRGQLIKDMRYWIEVIRETGNSYRYDNTSSREEIKAWALDIGASYYWNIDSHPVFTLEYAYGSGDADRQNVTNTVDGNTADDDTNFLYFGYYPGGYALAPRLSNIRVFGIGASFKPLELLKEKAADFGDFQVGTKCYAYRKDKADGGISDVDATQTNKDIGYELDVYASWRILSDLMWSLQYGNFHPGKAYPNKDNENYLYTNLVLSF
jgi:hypothetical protein